MAHSIHEMLVADDDLDREVVRHRMHELWQLKQSRPQLFKGSSFTIEAKLRKTSASNSRLEKYKGPDTETVEYVRTMKSEWSRNPQSFWLPPTTAYSSLTSLSPEAQMVALYLQATPVFDHHGASQREHSSVLGYHIYLPPSVSGDHDPVKVFNEMLTKGSRYNNLGKHLGRGVVFVLGNEVVESFWTKDLPKSESSPDFKAFLQNAIAGNLAPLAREYTGLCKNLIDWYRQHLTGSSAIHDEPTSARTVGPVICEPVQSEDDQLQELFDFEEYMQVQGDF
ncbi:hypothetical protein M409DRAFT_22352 [Zasmidium cellare ATCC 36951]|uniref:Uncharacterized protein n=1 Tax=Zasmidium cellare ATCC 36951 TaxID=1080233 RepID=A0A6A6CJY6_ZASCE|nr:uncharacterized protein M409DRAFT_22352 [Zasmidium cellare ATCC 36951]KAF2167547.1 hypothetical protein M409DRAFT_22352 [Zasmidium cellare ATCC 36951]